MLSKTWKKSFSNGIAIPAKMRRCDNSKSKILCATCINQINQNKDFEANLN